MIRNIIAVILGVVAGGIVNMMLVMVGHSIIPLPGGIDITTMEGLNAAAPLMETRHFVFPFLAHAVGTFAGAAVAALIAATNKIHLCIDSRRCVSFRRNFNVGNDPRTVLVHCC